MKSALVSFLLGVIATTSFIAGLIFLRFWRESRDSFFLIFAVSFVVEGINRVTLLGMQHPNEGSPWTYLVRFISAALIVAAIIRKNYSKNG